MTYSHFDFKYIDLHTHFFPDKIFKAIWNFFEQKDNQGNVLGWLIKYKFKPEKLIQILKNYNVEAFTTLNYAHKKGVAEYINNWTIEFVKIHENAIPFGCVWPEDDNKIDYTIKILDDHNFLGLKVQPLVQNFYPYDKRLKDIYGLIIEKDKWYVIHAGTAPYANKYVGFKNFIKLIEKYPNMNIIVAHLGTYEYKQFFNLLDTYDNLYLDTAMVFVPGELFQKWKKDFACPTPEELLLYQDRILYGSDFPNIPYEYDISTKGLLELDLPRRFYEKVFYKNAKRIFKLRTNFSVKL